MGRSSPYSARSTADRDPAAFNDRTRAIIINTPHNPTGKVFTRAELALIAELAQRGQAGADGG